MRMVLRLLLAGVIVVHGLLHLLGAAKGFGWADITALTQPIGPAMAAVWLAAAALVTAAGLMLALKIRGWWIAAIVAAVVSQDDVIPHPMAEYSRGVTIHGRPGEVWPWLAQMGYGRAGWYTPERLDRWANRWVWRLEDRYPFRPSPWDVVPELQDIAVGGSRPLVDPDQSLDSDQLHGTFASGPGVRAAEPSI